MRGLVGLHRHMADGFERCADQCALVDRGAGFIFIEDHSQGSGHGHFAAARARNGFRRHVGTGKTPVAVLLGLRRDVDVLGFADRITRT